MLIDVDTTVHATDEVSANIKLVFANGAKLTINSGVELTISGSLDAGVFQIFSYVDATSKVIISPSSCIYLYPEWWGAVSDGVTDCTAAFQAAVDCSDQNDGTTLLKKSIFLTGVKYLITGTITSKLGALFVGGGATGANPNMPTTIYHNSPYDLFVWMRAPDSPVCQTIRHLAAD